MKILTNAARVFLVLTAMASSAALLTGCKHTDPSASSSASAQKYTCSMHPEVVADSAGKCPKCGMELVEKK